MSDSRSISVKRRKLIVTGTTALAGLAAAGTSTLAQASKEAKHYTDVEQANLKAMQSYFNGLKTKDVSRIRFASNVIFTTVIIPHPVRGEAAVRELTQGFANRLLGIRTDRLMIDGNYGCARFEIDWPEKVVAHSIDYFQFNDGKIVSVEVYWDPREFLALPKRTSKLSPLSSLTPHHVALSVPNFKETLQWYQDKLDFQVVQRLDLPKIATKQAILKLNEFVVEVFARDNSTRLKPPAVTVPDDLLIQGVKHIAFMVNDLEAVAAELAEARGQTSLGTGGKQ